MRSVRPATMPAEGVLFALISRDNYRVAGAVGEEAGFRLLPAIRNEQVRSLNFTSGNSTVSPSAVWSNLNLPL